MDDRVKDQADETDEWLDALDSVEAFEGVGRVDEFWIRSSAPPGARARSCPSPPTPPMSTPSLPMSSRPHPGNRDARAHDPPLSAGTPRRSSSRANKESSELGGHIASFQSAATLYDTGFMHFWHAPTTTHGGDLIYFQGHCSPGIYARAFLEGRLERGAARQLPAGGRRQGPVVLSASLADAGFLAIPDRIDGSRAADGDLSGAVPAVSAWPRARRYRRRARSGRSAATARWTSRIARRDLARGPRAARQPDFRHQLQSAAARRAGARQRQDRPGARGRFPRRRLECHQGACGAPAGTSCSPRTSSGILRQRMEECVDGEYQDFKSKNGAYVRKHFFGSYPETAAMVADLSDDEIWALTRGGHDPDQGLCRLQGGRRAQGPADCHSRQDRQGLRHGRGRRRPDDHPSGEEDGRRGAAAFRDRFQIPVPDEEIEELPFLKLAGRTARR